MNHRKEAVDRALRGANLGLHAQARVEHDAEADRQIRRWHEVFDRLRLPVFFHDEIVAREIRYRPALAVDDGRDNVDQEGVAPELSTNECAEEYDDDRRPDPLPVGAHGAKAGSHHQKM
jgi:hypothetical protein